MFSKEASKRIREEFWISFGKSFPRKWVLYNTKIKEVSFKFHFDTKKARVSIEIECANSLDRAYYFDKFQSLTSIIQEEIPSAIFEQKYLLENQKEIAIIYTQKNKVSIHNKASWQETMVFLKENMEKFELIWENYEDFIKS